MRARISPHALQARAWVAQRYHGWEADRLARQIRLSEQEVERAERKCLQREARRERWQPTLKRIRRLAVSLLAFGLLAGLPILLISLGGDKTGDGSVSAENGKGNASSPWLLLLPVLLLTLPLLALPLRRIAGKWIFRPIARLLSGLLWLARAPVSLLRRGGHASLRLAQAGMRSSKQGSIGLFKQCYRAVKTNTCPRVVVREDSGAPLSHR